MNSITDSRDDPMARSSDCPMGLTRHSSLNTRHCSSGLHVAIIMDGSGRWATARGLARSEGHLAGMVAVGRVVDAAAGLGIGVLTLFAFSQDNWRRPAGEVAGLMRIFQQFLASESQRLAARGVRISVLGRRDRLPPPLLAAVDAAEAASVRPVPGGTGLRGHTLHLRLAIDYSGRDAILRAAGRLNGAREASPEVFTRLLAEDEHAAEPVPDVDLLIRTGREQRLSDCPLWEIAYAELVFTECLWPDFGAAELEAVLREFQSRERRFGRILEPVAT